MTLLAIKSAIVSQLQEKVSIPVYAVEVAEGYEMPSFCVFCLPGKRGKKGLFWQEKRVDVTIVYYPKNTGRMPEYLEIMEIADKLDAIFETNIKIEDRQLEILGANWEKADNVLEYSFYLEFLDSLDSLEEQQNDTEHSLFDKMNLNI